MNRIDWSKKKFTNDRSEIRKEVINEFLNEDPGTGKGAETSKYDYITMVLSDDREVFLRRPARNNNGFDFTLNVSDTNFNEGLDKRASTRPTHGNITDDLINKRNENSELYKELFEQIENVFNCKEVIRTDFDFKSGHSTILLLECIKWLFVEQDVTYWNYSGRGMFFDSIKNV